MPLASSPDWAAIWLAAATTSALPIIFVAYRQFRDSARTRHAQLLVDLSARWGSQELQEAYVLHRGLTASKLLQITQRAYGEPPEPESMELFYKLERLPDFFEVVGGLWRYEGCFPDKVIDMIWGYAIPSAWAIWSPTAAELNKLAAERMQNPQKNEVYENFRRLAQRLEELANRQPSLWKPVWPWAARN